MHRCVRTIHDDLVRTATGIIYPDSNNTAWSGLMREFKEAVGYWFDVNSIVTSRTRTEDVSVDLSLNRESGSLGLTKLLGVERLGLSESFYVRKIIAQSVVEAARHDDVDEVILAIGTYLRLEEGQQVPEIDRTIADRGSTTSERDDSFLVAYKWRPQDADWENYESWIEDPFLEGDFGDGPPSSESRRQLWWNEAEQLFTEPDRFRLEQDCPNLSNKSFQNAASALRPVFAAIGRENRYGLNLAVWAMIDFVKARSELAKIDVGDIPDNGAANDTPLDPNAEQAA
jgi:hypothetical protein